MMRPKKRKLRRDGSVFKKAIWIWSESCYGSQKVSGNSHGPRFWPSSLGSLLPSSGNEVSVKPKSQHMNQSLLFSVQKNLRTESLTSRASGAADFGPRPPKCGDVGAVAKRAPRGKPDVQQRTGDPAFRKPWVGAAKMCFLFPSLSNPEGHQELTNPPPTPHDLSSGPLTPSQAHCPLSWTRQASPHPTSLLADSLVFALLLSKAKETKCHYYNGRHWLAPSRSASVSWG